MSRESEHSGSSVKRGPTAAFFWGIPIGCLGGLIGLGGAEFRLPVLVRFFQYTPRRAVPLNLSVSMLTVVTALITRLLASGVGTILTLQSLAVVILALAIGGFGGAYTGAAWSVRITEHIFRRAILFLLVGIGTLLLIEAFTAWSATSLVSSTLGTVTLGIGIGFGIGIVSSLLGVAGGELIIPTLILVFGVDIKLAGTASLAISVPTMLVGIHRHWKNQAFAVTSDIGNLIVPMGLGSIIGAVSGGALIGYFSTTKLKFALGLILIGSAAKVFGGKESLSPSPQLLSKV